MTRNDYISIYNSGIVRRAEEAERLFASGGCSDPDLYADEDFEETATVDEIVGYYLYMYGEESYEIWNANTENIKMTSRDKEVDSILKRFDKGVAL